MKFKRRMTVAAAILMFAAAIYTGQSIGAQEETGQLTNQDFIRFHVIANSDTSADQALKLKVRDGVLAMVNQGLVEYTVSRAEPKEGKAELTLEQSRQYVQEHLEEISHTAQQIIRTNGYRYPVAVRIGPRYVPEKTYGNVTFPAGEYEALNIVIGEGAGENWWCVLFPPLCTVGAQPVDPKYDSLWDAMESEEPVKLQLKFKSLEYLEQMKK